MKKKLLFVNISLVNGGAEKSLVNLLNELPSNKYDIDLLLFRNEGMFINQVPSNVNFIEPPTALVKLYKPINKAGIYSIIKLIGTFLSKIKTTNNYTLRAYRWKHFYKPFIPQIHKKYDVAIAYVVGEVTYFIDDLVKAKRKIAWVHTDYKNAKCDPSCDKECYKNMDAIVTISEKCSDILKATFPEFNNKIYNIPNITSSTIIRKKSKEYYPKEYNNNRFIILSIGRLVPLKGFDLAIKVAALLKSENILFSWYLVGNGECKNSLNNLINKNNISDVFFMLGPKDNPYPYIKNADLLVQLSKYEGKSVVLDESKILGTPIVVTNYETVYDQIIDTKEGIIVERNEKKIANIIKQLILNSSKRLSIKSYLESREYGNQHEVQKYISIIEGSDNE